MIKTPYFSYFKNNPYIHGDPYKAYIIYDIPEAKLASAISSPFRIKLEKIGSVTKFPKPHKIVLHKYKAEKCSGGKCS